MSAEENVPQKECLKFSERIWNLIVTNAKRAEKSPSNMISLHALFFNYFQKMYEEGYEEMTLIKRESGKIHAICICMDDFLPKIKPQENQEHPERKE